MAEPEKMAQIGLKLYKFNVEIMKRYSRVVVIGHRETGKSVLIADWLYHCAPFPCGTVISRTESVSPFYSNFVPESCIHDNFNPAIIANVIKSQSLIKKQHDKEITETGATSINDARTFIVLDDCFCDDTWTRDVGIRFLFMNGLHIQATCLIAMPFAITLPPNLRGNIDYVFIFREPNLANRERIWRQYATAKFPDFDSFCQIMDQCTQNYGCLVIDNTSCSSKIEDQVLWYKAEMHPKFNFISTPALPPTSSPTS